VLNVKPKVKKNISENTSVKSPYVEIHNGDLVFMEKDENYENGFGQNTSQKTYVLKVRDMPTLDKPREKLLEYGTSSLSLAELLSVVLITGTKKEDVISMSSRVMKEYGKSIFSNPIKDIKKISLDMDIPITKMCQIIACGELGKRLFDKNLSGIKTIRTVDDVYDHTKDMHGLSKEHLRGLYLDTHNKVIHDEVLSIGTINSSIVHPREVFKPAIEYGAAAIILVHNHPSGISTPSESDKAITEQIIKAGKVLGIALLDHVVVTRDGFTSVPVEY
jgi:DNA repair protein RadC